MAETEEVMVMGPNGTLVPRELGVDFGVENYETYEEAIDALSEQQTAAEKQTIEVNWNIGRQAWIVSAGAKYGSHSIEEFAKDLDMSMSSVYTARNFYSKYSLDAVHRLIDNNLSYRLLPLAVRKYSDSPSVSIISMAAVTGSPVSSIVAIIVVCISSTSYLKYFSDSDIAILLSCCLSVQDLTSYRQA